MKPSFSSAMMIPVTPIPPILPVGYRFDPTDEEIIGYYLVLLLHGLYNNDMPIGVVNFWEFEPWDLPGLSRIKSDDQVWYFFCRRVIYTDKKKKMFKRKTQVGHWKPTGESTIIENLGKRSTLRFYKDSPKVEKTEWIAYEYEIKQTSTLHNPGEFVIIKLMNSSGEKRTKMKAKMSKQNFKNTSASASVYDRNQSLDEEMSDEEMSISDCCSHKAPAEVMTFASCASLKVVPSDFDTGEPSFRATSGCQNQTSVTEVRVSPYIPENQEENEQSNCLWASDLENQKLPSEIEDSTPKTTACPENQVTQNEDDDLSFLEDEEFWSYIDFNVDYMANETFTEGDPEVLAGQDAFREPNRSLNPGEQQVGCAEQCM